VKKKMQETGLFDKWTMQGLLDELDVIELFEAPGYTRRNHRKAREPL
jgi:hypothetical protein